MNARTLSYAEACRELRRSHRLWDAGKITGAEWLASVHRILEAFMRSRA